MTKFSGAIQQVDLTQINETDFERRYVGCIVLIKDNKILLQQRGANWDHFPGYLSEFGGQIEADESPIQALVRELREELGAVVGEHEVVSFGAITEKATKYTELVHIYFWHDKKSTITGCYEGELKYFDSVQAVFDHSNVMESARWLLHLCLENQLLK